LTASYWNPALGVKIHDIGDAEIDQLHVFIAPGKHPQHVFSSFRLRRQIFLSCAKPNALPDLVKQVGAPVEGGVGR